MNKRMIIIDGNSLINRAYYAMRNPMITSEGIYTQGIYGFVNMLNKIIKDYPSGYMVVTFDRKAPTFRHLEYADYKAGRKKMPPELAMQFPLLKEVLEAMNIKILEMDGFEADDLIGTVSKQSEDRGIQNLIITGDKDALQLVSDLTNVIITKKGITDFDRYDLEKMDEIYGLTPKQFIDLKGLMGDSSDNIPGIPGVGEKTALKLLHEFGSIENLISGLDEMKSSKLKTNIEENQIQAVMSKRLATIVRDVPIEINLEEYKAVEPDLDRLLDVYAKLEFNSFIRKISKFGSALEYLASKGGQPASGETFKHFDRCKEIVDTKEKIVELFKYIDEKSEIAIHMFTDNNHQKLPEVYGIGIMSNDVIGYLPVNNDYRMIETLISEILRSKCSIYGHSLNKEYYILLSYMKKMKLEDFAAEGGFYFNTLFDIAIAQYVLEPSKNKFDLKTLALELLSFNFLNLEEFQSDNSQMNLLENPNNKYLDYLETWINVVDEIRNLQTSKISKEGLDRVFYEVELPLIEPMASMEARGFMVNRQELMDIGKKLGIRIEELTRAIFDQAGETFNLNSPKQLGVILFEKLGLPSGKKTQTGYSTSAEILEKIKSKHKIVEDVLDYRTVAKLKSTYIEGLLPLISKDERIHPHFQQTVTATGRISCTEPNLQNIPIRYEIGREIRKAFITEEGNTLIGADYSQIELRILAHMSGEDHLIEAFNRGDDIHKITASKVFDIPEEEVSLLHRSNAKAVNFGVIYGMSSFGLSEELGISIKEAESYIKDYFKANPKVKLFLDKLVDDCKRDGYITTIMDRKRYISEISSSNFKIRQLGERLAMNSPVQGSAADIIKLAMIEVYRAINRNKLSARLILQVHDELILETPKSETEKVKKLLKDCMESAVELKIKLEVDINQGDNWYELK